MKRIFDLERQLHKANDKLSIEKKKRDEKNIKICRLKVENARLKLKNENQNLMLTQNTQTTLSVSMGQLYIHSALILYIFLTLLICN